MGLRSDLESEVAAIFKTNWSERDGTVVPAPEDIKLSNEAVNLDATVLYADISDSTKLVDNYKNWFAAEVYKAFLLCSARIIVSENGAIRAYDGDRVMAIFIGDNKCSSAARAALKINWACKNLIQGKIDAAYKDNTYKLKHTVGIDKSKLYVARAGFRGSNDLIWIGRAANYAAKLCTLDHDYPTWITADVYKALNDGAKNSGQGVDMWEARTWTSMNNLSIYRSNYWWEL